MRIVIVEDEAPIREGMEKILKKLSPSYVLAGKACDGWRGLRLSGGKNRMWSLWI